MNSLLDHVSHYCPIFKSMSGFNNNNNNNNSNNIKWHFSEYHSKCSVCVTLLSFHHNPMRQVLYIRSLIPFCRYRNWDTERWQDLPQGLPGSVGIWILAVWLQSSCSHHHTNLSLMLLINFILLISSLYSSCCVTYIPTVSSTSLTVKVEQMNL